MIRNMKTLFIIPLVLMSLVSFPSWSADLYGYGKGLKCEGINFIFVGGKLVRYEFGGNELEPKVEYPFKVDLNKIYFKFSFVETYVDRKTLIWHLPS